MLPPSGPDLVYKGKKVRQQCLTSIGEVIRHLPMDGTVLLLYSENQKTWYVYQNGNADPYHENMTLPNGVLPADLCSDGGGGAVVPVPVAASSASAPTSSVSVPAPMSSFYTYKMGRSTPFSYTSAQALTSSASAPTSSVPALTSSASAPTSSVPAPMSSASAPTSSASVPMGSAVIPLVVITDDSLSMRDHRITTVDAVCRLIGNQDPNTDITIRGFNTLKIEGRSDTVANEFKRVYYPSGSTPLFSTLVNTIKSFPHERETILVAFTDGINTDDMTAESVKAALAERPKVVFWFMASIPEAERIGESMGAHSILPYSDKHIGAALDAVGESQEVYRRTGTVGEYKLKHRNAAMGRA